jgi:hypothetical protein
MFYQPRGYTPHQAAMLQRKEIPCYGSRQCASSSTDVKARGWPALTLNSRSIAGASHLEASPSLKNPTGSYCPEMGLWLPFR